MSTIEWSKRYGLRLLAACALTLVVGWQWKRARDSEASVPTISAASLPVTSRAVRAEGRLVTYPGAEVVVGTDLGGTLKTLSATEKAQVHKGDVLAEIEASEQKAALAEARAHTLEVEADLRFLAVEKERAARLVATSAAAQDLLDRSAHDLDAAQARRASAIAAAARLAAVVAKSTIVAPIDGVVLERIAEVGETLVPGARLARLADLRQTRVEAEVDEYDAGRIVLGQAVTISAEGFAGSKWQGRVEEIPDAVTSRRLKPEDPGRPSDTRVLLVKIALSEPVPIKLGQRVEVEIQAR